MPKRGCQEPGCEGAHVARGYCMRHYQRKRWHGELATVRGRAGERIEQRSGRYAMFSTCCVRPATEGEQHENGKQYCSGCGEPCFWRWLPAPSTMNDARTAPPSQ